MSNGRKLNRRCRATKVADGLEPTIAVCLKEFCGHSRPARAGVICPRNIPVPPRAGGAWPFGRNKVFGSKCGAPFFRNWTRAARWIGKKVFWTPVSLQLKKRPRSRQNQARQGHKVDGGGRRPGCSSGKPTGLGRPGGSDAGRKHAQEHFCRPETRSPATAPPARDCRPQLRQRSVALAFAQTRRFADCTASQRTQKTLPQRWPGTPTLSQALESRADFRLARPLPPAVGSTRSSFACL